MHRSLVMLGALVVCLVGASCSSSSSPATSDEAVVTTQAATTTPPPTDASTAPPASTADSTAASAGTESTATSVQRAPEQTDFVTAEGTVRLLCAGAGDRPVILMAGGVDPPSVWDEVVDLLGDNVLSCRFDPTALTTKTTPGQRADALSAALDESGLDGPVVLVAHSLSALTVRQFGADHPDWLAAAVVLDGTTPSALTTARPDLEKLGWDVPATEAEVNASVTWPAVPVYVLAHDPELLTLGSVADEDLWTQGQQMYAALSPLGHYEVVTGSGHFIYTDAVQRVIATINTVLAGG